MTHHQYQSISGQIASWGLIILAVVLDETWASAFLLVLALVQIVVNLRRHWQVLGEKDQ
jgi:hypothetical protein